MTTIGLLVLIYVLTAVFMSVCTFFAARKAYRVGYMKGMDYVIQRFIKLSEKQNKEKI